MQDISFVINSNDLSLKYLMFFYELTKLGVVRFNLRNPSHLEMLAKIILLSGSYNPKNYENLSELAQLREKNRFSLYKLIAVNLYKWAEF